MSPVSAPHMRSPQMTECPLHMHLPQEYSCGPGTAPRTSHTLSPALLTHNRMPLMHTSLFLRCPRHLHTPPTCSCTPPHLTLVALEACTPVTSTAEPLCLLLSDTCFMYTWAQVLHRAYSSCPGPSCTDSGVPLTHSCLPHVH